MAKATRTRTQSKPVRTQNAITPIVSQAKGGLQDYHVHIDRARTCSDEFFAHTGRSASSYMRAPLTLKQDATGDLHLGSAYTEQSLEERMDTVIHAKIAAGETMANLLLDTSPDIDGKAVRVAKKVQKKYAGVITLNVFIYPIFGIKRLGSDRELHLREMAQLGDGILGLPERDDRGEPLNNVGFEGHCAILFDIALQHKYKHVQVHVDQTGKADERGTERLVEAVRYCFARVPMKDRPKVWAVHMISPSSYDEDRFWHLVRHMKMLNMGVIVCPHAAISMRQIRAHHGPMRNSIARGLELLASGIEVRFGTDNINDIFMPNPTSMSILREAGEESGVIQSAWRFYEQDIYNKILRGQALTDVDRYTIGEVLKSDYAASSWYTRPWIEIEKIKPAGLE